MDAKANHDCGLAADSKPDRIGRVQTPPQLAHQNVNICAKPKAASKSKLATAHQKAAAGNKSIFSFFKKRDCLEAALPEENQGTEPMAKDDSTDLPSKTVERKCQTTKDTEKAVRAVCDANKQQHDMASTKQLARKRTKVTKGELLQSARCWSMTVLTHKLMGTTTMLQETELSATELEPDVMVFTETKFTEDNKKLLDAPLKQYKLYHSCKSYIKLPGRRHQAERHRAGSAGVTIAVKTTFLTQASVTSVRIDGTAAKGHCKAVQNAARERLSNHMGRYIPHDPQERKNVYTML